MASDKSSEHHTTINTSITATTTSRESDDASEANTMPAYYVGIGASAGGLEALQEFFTHMPTDTGAAFIVVQHLSPDFKSFMPELLSKNTSMPICHASHEQQLEANRIYLQPPRSCLTIANGVLQLSNMSQNEGLHLPIDSFFRSLAEDQQHKSVGIVLSGTGSDGCRGIRALKEAGAMIMAQNPETAKFDGMPYNAVSTGVVDFVLDASMLPERLIKYLSHPLISGNAEPVSTHMKSNEDIMQQIFMLLEKKSKIDFGLYKPSTIARRIERRMGINQLSTLKEYFVYLLQSTSELDFLCRDMLIGVTRFFRDPDAFELLENKVIDELLERTPIDEPIRIWSVGCSTGEEPYSLAILCLEAMEKSNRVRDVKIFATDVDANAIAAACSGKYLLDIQSEVNEPLLHKYFKQDNGVFTVTTRVRQMVVFAAHNMIADPPFSNIDLLVCRNALIYFQPPSQKKVLAGFHFSLKKNGVLFLGPSENLGELNAHFTSINEHFKLYSKYSNIRIPLGTPPQRDHSDLQRSPQGMQPVQALLSRHHEKTRASPLNFIRDKIIEKYVPPSIVLNESYEVIHVYGEVHDFVKKLNPGRASLNIKDLIVDSLSIAVATALSKSNTEQADVFYKNVMVDIDDEHKLVNLQVCYIQDNKTDKLPDHYLLTFLSQESNIAEHQHDAIDFDIADQSRQRIIDLEQELIQNRDHLQLTIEELETANEELQSSNEELMSANEELQSTNEELQSVNEELYTVNSEYQDKISELTQSNNDLDNVIETSELGIIFLDNDTIIRKITPAVSGYFNVLATDIGRPLHHISHHLRYNELIQDVEDVGTSLETLEREVYTDNGHCLLMRITPYRTKVNDLTDGIVITFSNITRMKMVEGALQKAHTELVNPSVTRKHAGNTPIKVLVVDDDKLDREYLKKTLKKISDLEFDIVERTNVDEGVRCLREQRFDLCLLDYMLAAETAVTFVKKCRVLEISTPIIVLSGYSEASVAPELVAENIEGFISKTNLSELTLQRTIQATLGRGLTH